MDNLNLNDLRARVERLEQLFKEIEKTQLTEEELEIYNNMRQLLFGSERLGLKSMVSMVNELYTNWDRIKWLLGLIGVVSLSSLLGFLLLVREIFGG